MVKTLSLTILTLTLLITFSFADAKQQISPGQVAIQFYNAYLKFRMIGLPSEAQMDTLRPVLSKELQRLIESARRKQVRFIKEHPDEKPPWVDGDLFSSLFERADGYKPGKAIIRGNRAEVPIHLEYKGESSTGLHRWTDTLVLMRAEKDWVITDIRFNGRWPFKVGPSLRKVLSTK